MRACDVYSNFMQYAKNNRLKYSMYFTKSGQYILKAEQYHKYNFSFFCETSCIVIYNLLFYIICCHIHLMLQIIYRILLKLLVLIKYVDILTQKTTTFYIIFNLSKRHYSNGSRKEQ